MECSVPNEALFTPPLREAWVRACCAVAEGACVLTPPHVNAAAAALGDAQQRVTTLGGRVGYPRSLGSVAAGAIALFLGRPFEGVETSAFRVSGAFGTVYMAICLDGATLLCSVCGREIQVRRLPDGALLSTVPAVTFGGIWRYLRGICVAPDGAVFVADKANNCVLALDCNLTLCGLIGAGELRRPVYVSAGSDMVAVCCEDNADRDVYLIVALFGRADGALLRRLTTQLRCPAGTAFLRGGCELAVVGCIRHRVSIYRTSDGVLRRHVGEGLLRLPVAVTCSIHDEIVVADEGNCRIAVFTASGEAWKVFGYGRPWWEFAIFGNTVYAYDVNTRQCVAFR
jgi:hypothetical protein